MVSLIFSGYHEVSASDNSDKGYLFTRGVDTTSYAHELALSVIFESGLQYFADRPSSYYEQSNAVRQFLKRFPASWDETKLIDGHPGEIDPIRNNLLKI
ncbi:MAG TPA: hypothetical protein VF842_05245 [Flavobacterium sp.]